MVALKDAEGAVRIKAYLALSGEQRVSEIAMRAFCAKVLPGYMMPDVMGFLDVLPKTSTGKIDYQYLMRTS